jgi:hypothetical protein
MKRVILVYPDGRLDIEYLSKDQVLPERTKKAVYSIEEFMHCGDMPATSYEYTFLVREATLRANSAVQAAGHTILASGLCAHYNPQGNGWC